MRSTQHTALGLDGYLASVEGVAAAIIAGAELPMFAAEVPDLLDGHAALTLRTTVPLDVRREGGMFFSSSALRAAAIDHREVAKSASPALDPAVGAGDLLIEYAKHLPVRPSLVETLADWGNRLHGRDLRPELVRLARARLVICAFERGATSRENDAGELADAFPNIRVGDGLNAIKEDWQWGHVLLNPPFAAQAAPAGISWTTGRTNAAALFVASVVERAPAGVILTAILPDVLRTGTRYARLRSFIEEHMEPLAVESYGRFDKWTDVDVFILRGTKRSAASATGSVRWWSTPGQTSSQVGDYFDVAVGTVVPHRHKETGPPKPFLHARTIPLGGEFDVAGAEQRSFETKTFSPPFVVVRRTSRPGDRSRAMGTLVRGETDALVENHLLVVTPKRKTVDECRRLLAHLDSTDARSWLDERIRCRHLTSGALREMPWEWS